jgi:hypothetical protein
LAVGFQWLAFGLVGFLAGHFLVQTALAHFEVTQNATIWILAGAIPNWSPTCPSRCPPSAACPTG